MSPVSNPYGAQLELLSNGPDLGLSCGMLGPSCAEVGAGGGPVGPQLADVAAMSDRNGAFGRRGADLQTVQNAWEMVGVVGAGMAVTVRAFGVVGICSRTSFPHTTMLVKLQLI